MQEVLDDLEAELKSNLHKAAHTQLLHETELHQAAAEVAELCHMLYETFPDLGQSEDTNEEPPLPPLAITAPDVLELQVCIPVPLASHDCVAVKMQ